MVLEITAFVVKSMGRHWRVSSGGGQYGQVFIFERSLPLAAMWRMDLKVASEESVEGADAGRLLRDPEA